MNTFCRVGILTASGIIFAGCAAPTSRVSSTPPSQSPTAQTPPVTTLKPKAKPADVAQVGTIKFSTDGKLLLVGCAYYESKTGRSFGSAQIYDASTKKVIKSWRVSEAVNKAILLPRRRAMLSSGGQTQLWDWGKEKLLKTVSPVKFRSVLAVSPDGARTLSGTTIYRTRSLKQQSQLKTKWGEFIRTAAFSPSGDRLVTGAWDAFKGIEAFDARTGQLLWTGIGDIEGNIAWAPSGQVISAVTTGGVQLYNAANGKLLRKLNDKYGGDTTFLNKGNHLAFLAENELTLYEVSSGRALKNVPLKKGFLRAISPDGRTLAQVAPHSTQVEFQPLQIKF